MKTFGIAVLAALVLLAILMLRIEPFGPMTPIGRTMLFDFRLPRILMALMVGSGMALSGWTAQTATRNPLASPELLSVPAAAAFGVMLTLWLTGGALLGSKTLPLIAGGAGVASALLVFALAGRRRKLDGSGLLLTGIALGSLLTAAYMFIALNASTAVLQYGLSFLAGSLARASWDYVWMLLPAWWMLTLATIAFANHVQVLLFEDSVVSVLGMTADTRRRAFLGLSAALSAMCVAVGGNMAFIAFASPHIVRRATGRTLAAPWMVAATGAVLLLISDWIGQFLIRPGEIPAGIVTTVAGAPLFVIFMLRRKAIQ